MLASNVADKLRPGCPELMSIVLKRPPSPTHPVFTFLACKLAVTWYVCATAVFVVRRILLQLAVREVVLRLSVLTGREVQLEFQSVLFFSLHNVNEVKRCRV